MTVSTEISSNEYTGNGLTTDFDYKFRIFKANQLSVITSDADGDNVVSLKMGTDYTVTGAKKSAGGKVILTKPLASGHKISIAREIPITQETSFRNQSKFFAETHEDAFDYLTMILQRIWGSLGSLYLKRPNILANWFDAKGYRIANLGKPKRDSDAVDLGTLKDEIGGINSTILTREKRLLRVDDMDITALPKASERTGNVLTFDKDGNPIAVAPATGSAVDVLNKLASDDGASYVGSTNYAGLRSYVGANSKIDVYGRKNIFDGGDGIFILDATDVSSADNDVTILVDALNRRWKREVKNGHYDARWAGVVADGITDNTEAFTKLSATIKKQHSVMLVPAGTIKTGSVKLPVEYCEIRGAGKYSTVIQFLDKSNSIKIMEACKVSHMTISGVGAWLGANAHDVLILDDKEHNRSDVDLYVDNCLLNNTKFVARIFGRGFELTNCNTNDLSEWILDLQFPEPFEPGPDPSLHSIIEGMRHYKFLNNRIHYAGKGLINNTGYNAVNAKNFLINGNTFEGNITLLNGYMKGAVITGNEFVHGYDQRIFNAEGLEDITFIGNNVDFKVGGYATQTQTQIFSSNGKFKNITITGNNFTNLNKQVVYLHGDGEGVNDRSDVIISGNSYNNCFGSLAHLFELQSGSVDRLTIDETLKSPSETWLPVFQSVGMNAVKNYSVSVKTTGSNEVHNLHSSQSTGGMRKQGVYNGNDGTQTISVGFMPRSLIVRGSNNHVSIVSPEFNSSGGVSIGYNSNRSFTVTGLANINNQRYIWIAES